MNDETRRLSPQRLVLLDLDGTLLASRGVGRRALEVAFEDLYGWGEATGGLSFGGLTDPLILQAVFTSHGESAERAVDENDRVMARYLEALDGLLAQEPNAVWSLPGVEALLDAVVAHPDCVVGVLTGNVEGGARRKLRAAGLGEAFFEVGAFGDEAPTRNDLLPVALNRANRGRDPWLVAQQVVIVGDTPRDVAVARAHGARVLGVSTGATPHDLLAASEPDVLLRSLESTEAVLAAILD
ncbi:MAG: haloacid dehalogenase-like hydrolase [Planctomycetes bacterium]|nr:haloacid dehalogenase-like hydrolase [Planctomycetota bacterium]